MRRALSECGLVMVRKELSSTPCLVSSLIDTLCSLRDLADAFSVISRFRFMDSLTDFRSSSELARPRLVVMLTVPNWL
ncbi:hypothetical protein D3C71_1601150 [compost metagenome]